MAFSLTKGIKVQAFMLSDDLSIGGYNFPRLIRDKRAEEIAHFHLTNEADPLTVFFRGVGQIESLGKVPHFGLEQVPDRKPRFLDLMGLQEREKVTLVLARIASP